MLIVGVLPANATIKLPSIFADNMVLQRGKVNTVWGWANPGETVQVGFRQKQYQAHVTKDGTWRLNIGSLQAGVADSMVISAGKEKLVLRNIAVGEVWVCSGQSNMEFTMGGFKEWYKEEIATANDPELRFVVLKNAVAKEEANDAVLLHSWASINASSVAQCSAVAYFFAKKLRDKLHVPVGLVISSWGGTPAQSWMDTAALTPFPNYASLYKKVILPLDLSAIDEQKSRLDKIYQQKITLAAPSFQASMLNDYSDAGWETCRLPGVWEENGHPDLDGVCAYRFRVTIPPGYDNKPAELHLPGIDDIDSTYINGHFVGTHRVWDELRTYQVPAGILREGVNVISIWVEDTGGGGGLNDDPEHFYLKWTDKSINLAGEAKFKLLVPAESIAPGVNLSALQNQPSVLFNAMISPLLPYGIKGVIWYQGEANVPAYEEYRRLFPALISNWRQRWNNPALPFFFVQLSSFNPSGIEPIESNWAALREAQTYALRLPHTGMAVSTDVGERKDIHPKRKKEVGDRLAANALHMEYGFTQEEYIGPVFKSATKEHNGMIIHYDHTGSGLKIIGDKLQGFAIAGKDKKFVPADAVIRDGNIFVSAKQVPSPVYIRYAWANAPLEANLYNAEGFPAVPFRTDQ
jgi:sialate O-acetylesterase